MFAARGDNTDELKTLELIAGTPLRVQDTPGRIKMDVCNI